MCWTCSQVVVWWDGLLVSKLPCSLAHFVALTELMQDERGETALFAASAHGHLETATLLLQYGAVVNYQDKVRLLFICPWSTVMVWHRMVCSV